MNSLQVLSSDFSETYMLLIDYPYIRGEELPDYVKESSCNLLHAYTYLHSQRWLYECPGNGVQTISRFQYLCANMKSFDQSRYNIMFQQVVHKGGES